MLMFDRQIVLIDVCSGHIRQFKVRTYDGWPNSHAQVMYVLTETIYSISSGTI